MYKLPSYVVGLLLTCAVAAYGPYQETGEEVEEYALYLCRECAQNRRK